MSRARVTAGATTRLHAVRPPVLVLRPGAHAWAALSRAALGDHAVKHGHGVEKVDRVHRQPNTAVRVAARHALKPLPRKPLRRSPLIQVLPGRQQHLRAAAAASAYQRTASTATATLAAPHRFTQVAAPDGRVDVLLQLRIHRGLARPKRPARAPELRQRSTEGTRSARTGRATATPPSARTRTTQCAAPSRPDATGASRTGGGGADVLEHSRGVHATARARDRCMAAAASYFAAMMRSVRLRGRQHPCHTLT